MFILDNTVGKGRLLFVASHGQGPVDNIVISGNHLQGHTLTIDAVPPEGRRRSNWIITNNVSDTDGAQPADALLEHRRPRRFRQHAEGQRCATGGCRSPTTAVHASRTMTFGGGGVVRNGTHCNAAVVVPKTPAILGRGTPTTTTSPPSHGATTTVPPVTFPRPPRTFVPNRPQPPTPAVPANSGSNPAGWLARRDRDPARHDRRGARSCAAAGASRSPDRAHDQRDVRSLRCLRRRERALGDDEAGGDARRAPSTSMWTSNPASVRVTSGRDA